MRRLGRADPERVSAERAVRRGMAVAANDRQARQRQPLFRRDDVHDSLARIVQPDQPDPRAPRIVFELPEHLGEIPVAATQGALARWHIVVRDPEGELGMRDAPAPSSDLIECKERPLMHKMAVDPDEARPVLARRNRVGVPELVDEGAASL